MKLSVALAVNGGEDEIISWTDTTPSTVEYLSLKSTGGYTHQIRNIRNPDSAAALCMNTVGSFNCIDMSEEKVQIPRLQVFISKSSFIRLPLAGEVTQLMVMRDRVNSVL